MFWTQARCMIEDEESEVSDFRLSEMPSLASVEAKGKQKATDEEVLTFDDSEGASDSGSSSESSSNSGSDKDLGSESDTDSRSPSGSGTSTGHELGSNTNPGPSADERPLSRDELLVYLDNLRRRFSTKSTVDCFADQEEEVLIVTSKKKLGLIHPRVYYDWWDLQGFA
jgi:hypothetical protein